MRACVNPSNEENKENRIEERERTEEEKVTRWGSVREKEEVSLP